MLGACAAYGDEVCAGAVASSESGMGQVGEALAYTYGQIHTAAPSAKIAVLGYPRLFEPADGNPYFSAEEQRLINRATDNLNTAIATAVSNANAFGANAQFVDVTARFAGHAVNSTDPWIAYKRRESPGGFQLPPDPHRAPRPCHGGDGGGQAGHLGEVGAGPIRTAWAMAPRHGARPSSAAWPA